MILQIICNTIMFAAYIGNIIYSIGTVIDIPKGLRTLEQESADLSEKQKFHLHQHKFTRRFALLLAGNAIFLAIGVATCLLDGLSDTENYLLVPTWTFLAAVAAGILFFPIYTTILERKYHIVMGEKTNPYVWNRGTPAAAQMAMCMSTAIVFAFNSALTAYTIALLVNV